MDMRLSIELKAKAIEIINVTMYRKNFISSIASFTLSSFGILVNCLWFVVNCELGNELEY